MTLYDINDIISKMSDLLIRDVPQSLKKALQQRASLSGCSLSNEVTALLREALQREKEVEAAKNATPLVDRIRKRLKKTGFVTLTDTREMQAWQRPPIDFSGPEFGADD